MMGIWLRSLLLFGAMVTTPALAGKASKQNCAEALTRPSITVTRAAKEALVQAKETGTFDARVVLQIPTFARGVLPPYVQLIVERDRLKAELEKAGAAVAIVENTEAGVSRLTLDVYGPYENVLKIVLANEWVARILTKDDSAGIAPMKRAPDHNARKAAALLAARAHALQPGSVDLESTVLSAIRAGYALDPIAVEVMLIATVAVGSLFVATIPADRGEERHTLAFLLHVSQRGDAYDVKLGRVLEPEELSVFLP